MNLATRSTLGRLKQSVISCGTIMRGRKRHLVVHHVTDPSKPPVPDVELPDEEKRSLRHILGGFLLGCWGVLMAVGAITIGGLAASGRLPQRSWRVSDVIVCLLLVTFGIAAFIASLRSTPRSVKPTLEEQITQWKARSSEVKQALRRRVSFDEAVAMMETEGGALRHFRVWYETADRADAELWRYVIAIALPAPGYDDLASEWGFALVREGEVTDLFVEAES